MLNDPTGLIYRYRPLEDDSSWRELAECKGAPVELFFPEKGEQDNVRIIVEKFCSVCPVQDECLEFGKGENHGIWGGKAGKEIRALRSGRVRKDFFVKHGTVAGYYNHVRTKKDEPCAWCTAAYDADNYGRGQVS
jgi:hypothetical protein